METGRTKWRGNEAPRVPLPPNSDVVSVFNNCQNDRYIGRNWPGMDMFVPQVRPSGHNSSLHAQSRQKLLTYKDTNWKGPDPRSV